MDGLTPATQPGAPVSTTVDRAELARLALVPIVPNGVSRCPRCGVRLLSLDTKACPRCNVDPHAAEAASRLVPVGTSGREFLRGASYVPRGFFMILSSPRLWPTAILPLLLNILIFGLVVAGGIWILNHALQPLASPEALPEWSGWWIIPKYIIKFTANAAGWLSFLMVPLLTAWLMSAFPFSIILRAIFMPFATLVGERAEQITLELPSAKEKFRASDFFQAMTVSIIDTVLLALVQAVLYIVLIPLALIPPIWMIVPPGIMAGMDHTDPTFCRKNYTITERMALWKARKWRFLGFGLTFFFLLGIPFVNAVIFPVVAVGAALLYLELDRK